MKRIRKQRLQAGFTLLEMMLVIAILSIVMGIVFNSISLVQKREKTEEARLDVTQQGREFMDEIVRDLHNAGYPNTRMYGTGALSSPVANSTKLAVGLVAVSATDLLFEGDVDGDGQVDSVRYTIQTVTDPVTSLASCPCSIRRSATAKTAAAPTSQATRYALELQNVVNSTGGGSAYPIMGTMPTGQSNNTVYASYKTAPVFAFFDATNTAVAVPNDLTGGNLATGQAAAANVKVVSITLNLLTTNPDQQTGLRSGTSFRSMVRIVN